MACASPSDVLKQRSEDLSEILYLRASWKDPVIAMIPRAEYPKGAGYVRSAFTVGRSEPTTDEETWAAIGNIQDRDNETLGVYSATTGACGVTYNEVEVGFKESTYEPELYGLSGPLICQDDLTMSFNTEAFWATYFQALEKRNFKSISQRLLNVFRTYVPKASANSSFAFTAGTTATQPPPTNVPTTDLDGANIPTSELTQEMLDATALELIQEGAMQPNSNGWITMGDQGPEFPLYIGPWMSKRLKLNNSELRADINTAWTTKEQMNPVLQRIGATYVLGNFRHVINLFPARWASGDGGTTLTRVPTWIMSTSATYATKGAVAVINPAWLVAPYESCEVLSPWVMTEEVLIPTNSLSGARLTPQNYYGQWVYVTGNDALLGFSSCTGKTDPTHKYGRHFAEYRHALKPIFPTFGRMILYKRCTDSFDTITCS